MTTSSFFQVLEAELAYIRRRHSVRKPPRRVKDGLVGLALSGGGIRSATTNLGVLQTLSKLQILPLVDYLCTVSGGGYIGGCLSSLLSIDTQTPPKPLQQGAAPMFTTEWDHFPFNPEANGGAAQIRHLRTHGSFLVTRKGVLKRETLRSIGQLVSGTVYHLLLVLLTLTAIALAYMTVLSYGSAAIDSALRNPTDPVPTYATAFEARETAAERPRYRPDSVTELTGKGTTAYTVPVVYEFPGLWDRIKAKAAIIWARSTDVVTQTWVVRALIGGAAFGVVVALISFVYLGRYRDVAARLRARQRAQPRVQPGESVEDALEVGVLRRAGRISLVAALLWIGLTLWLVEPEPAELWLLLPIVVIGAVRVSTWILHLCMPRLKGFWTRDMRSLWGAYQAIAVYALWAAVLLTAVPVLVYAFHEYEMMTGFTGVFSLIVARVLTLREGPDVKKWPIGGAILRWGLAVAIGVGLLLVIVTICTWIIELAPAGEEMWAFTLQWFVGVFVVLLLLGIVGDANRLSPHYFYRDRLAEAYLYTEHPSGRTTTLHMMRDTVELRLKDLHGEQVRDQPEPATTAPYHIISCAVNLAGSRDLTRKDRKSGYFMFSKYFCGSRHTGYRRTDEYLAGDIKMARAVTISGAATSSGVGSGTFFAQAFATVLFNLRLGYWMPNPSKPSSTSNALIRSWHFWPKWLWREITMATDERHSLINLSDGGHTGDNIGIYPLLQRRCRLIIACDAECDPALSFGSFTEAIRHAYIDLGIDIDIDLTMLRPDRETGMSRSHCAVGLIRYPPDATGARRVGHLVYLKNSLTGDEPETVLNYKSNNPVFPHESTADQFFDDAQFESYRSLGVHIAEHAFAQWASAKEFLDWRRLATP